MDEELLLTGKNNPVLDPGLEAWGLPIALYLFLGGMAAGILILTSIKFLRNRDSVLLKELQYSSQIAFLSLIVGIFVLLFDLHNVLNSWKLYLSFNWQSPMSWGAWVLLLILVPSFLWGTPFNLHLIRRNRFKKAIDTFASKFRVWIARLIIVLAIALGLYTGWLLSAFVARPLWNSMLLPPLFFISGLSSGAAVIIWMSKPGKDRKTYQRLDLVLLLLELFLIAIYMLDLFSGSDAQMLAIRELVIGQFAVLFWGLVIFIGIIVPAVLEWRELRGSTYPIYLIPALILIGGLAFRIIVVEAGQWTTL